MFRSLILIAVTILATMMPARVQKGYAASGMPPLPTVPQVNLTRYMGVWYEIARIDHSFQKGCTKSSAIYSMQSDGEVEVINRCVDGKDGRLQEAKGRAWSVDPIGNARLKVSFFWPFRGDYWIIDLGKDYEYAVVGAPNRNYLWILARQPVMEEAIYKRILEKLAPLGFAVDRLVKEKT